MVGGCSDLQWNGDDIVAAAISIPICSGLAICVAIYVAKGEKKNDEEEEKGCSGNSAVEW